MSEENVEIVRDLFERWNRGDYTKTEWAASSIGCRTISTFSSDIAYSDSPAASRASAQLP